MYNKILEIIANAKPKVRPRLRSDSGKRPTNTEMKIILSILICLMLFGCSSESPLEETNKKFSMDDLSTSGFKVKKDFQTTFPESTDA